MPTRMRLAGSDSAWLVVTRNEKSIPGILIAVINSLTAQAAETAATVSATPQLLRGTLISACHTGVDREDSM